MSREGVLAPLPPRSVLRSLDLAYAIALYAAVVAGLFIRHGGLARFASIEGTIAAIGQLAGLYGMSAALAGLFLMSRLPLIEQGIGPDRLTRYHRWLGFLTVYAVLLHAVASTFAYAGSVGALPTELLRIAREEQGGLGAVAAGAIFLVIGVSSLGAIRRAIGYEAWHTLHLLSYPALLLGFLHQFTLGTDLSIDPIGRSFWIGAYTFALSPLVYHRLLRPLWRSIYHDMRVLRIVEESDDVISVHLRGRRLSKLPHRSGQYFSLRFLTADGWFRSHPFSLSAGPNGETLRFTIKGLGDWTKRMRKLRRGTRVVIEGPYGVLHGGRRTKRRVLLIGGGIGITPLRALFETLPAGPGDLDLLYRASDPRDLIFRSELDAIAAMRGSSVHYLLGRREDLALDPLSSGELLRRIPDIADRDIYLCGPEPMMRALRRRLRGLGVRSGQIHHESFSW